MDVDLATDLVATAMGELKGVGRMLRRLARGEGVLAAGVRQDRR